MALKETFKFNSSAFSLASLYFSYKSIGILTDTFLVFFAGLFSFFFNFFNFFLR